MTRREMKTAAFEFLMLLLILMFLCMIPSSLQAQDFPIGTLNFNGQPGNFFRSPTLYVPMFCTSAPPVSASSQAAFYCDQGSNTLKVSINGGAFQTVAIGFPLGVTSGGTGQSTAATNQILIGTAANVLSPVTLPNCTAANNFYQYNNSTQTFSCVAASAGASVIASGTSTMPAVAILSGACGSTVTTAATGALTSDAVEWAFASTPTGAGDKVVITQPWMTAGNVNWVQCNPSGGSATPTGLVINWRVIR